MGKKYEVTKNTGVPGVVYILHFDEPYRHAAHYVGFAVNLEVRIEQHRKGRGARLTRVIKDAGIGFTVAVTMEGTRALERKIKNSHGAAPFCPICQEQKREEKARGKPAHQ